MKEGATDGQRDTYVIELVLALRRRGWRWVEDSDWCKKNAMPGKWPNRFQDRWEHVFHFAKERKFAMYQKAVREPIGGWAKTRLKHLSTADLTRLTSGTRSGFGRNMSRWVGKELVYPSNSLHIAPEAGHKGHSAAFPEPLPAWFIRLFTKRGDVVLDPFLGSGTTAVAALNLERHYIGIEKHPPYQKVALNRLDEARAQFTKHGAPAAYFAPGIENERGEARMTGDGWIDEAVRTGLTRFYATYSDAVNELELRPLLRKCNPWRLRALGLRDCTEVVQRLVEDHMSSSAESKFGNKFIETLVEMIPGVKPIPGGGIDFEKDGTLISVKSGSSWGNNDQWKSLVADATAALKMYKADPGKKEARFVLGIAVGRGSRTPRKQVFPFTELRGQKFWHWITDDPEAYQKIMDALDRLAGEYEEKRKAAISRLRQQMIIEFGLTGGIVDWKKLNAFVSAEIIE